MSKNRFSTIDLNLLRVFKILFEEKNARKASERLFVSQPAVSQSLQKLRYHFDDQLFVTVKTGLEPTPYAEALASEIMPFLYGLEKAMNESKEFVAYSLQGEVTIALSSSFSFSMSGRVYQYFKREAPELKVNIVSWNDNTLEKLEKGEILFGVNSSLEHQPKFIVNESVADLLSSVIVRSGHPILNEELGLEALSQYPFARLIVSDYSQKVSPPVEMFKRHGYDLTIGFSSEYPITLIDVVRNSDMFMAATDCFPVENHPGVVLLTQEKTGKEFLLPVKAYFHKRHTNSDLTNWLLDSFRAIFRDSKQRN